MLGNDKQVAPAINWAVATDFAYLKGKWFRVLLEVEGSASSFAFDAAAPVFRELIRVPTMYKQPPRGLKATDVTFCMAIMSQAALRMLVTGSGSSHLVQKFKSWLAGSRRSNWAPRCGRSRIANLACSRSSPSTSPTPPSLP